MNLPLFIARRYFFSRKSQRVINVISLISVVGIAIGTSALVIVLSVFNGFEDLIVRLYHSFDPDLKITRTEGKAFAREDFPADKIHQIPGVVVFSEIIEEKALVRYRDQQYLITLKGVDSSYAHVSGVDTMVIDGNFDLGDEEWPGAVVGGGVAYYIHLNLKDKFSQLEIFAPRKAAGSLSLPDEAFNRRYISATGVFAVQQEFDSKYIIVPAFFAKELLDYDDEITSVEVDLSPGSDHAKLQAQIKEILGEGWVVKNRYEMHELIYRIMKSEKWAVFLILTFILIIATFNVISSLTMLVIEKKKDIAILHSLGAGTPLIRKIFILEGFMITMTGAVAGMIIGFFICWAQQTFGIVTLSGSGTFVIDAYPVLMLPMDFLYVLLTVGVIGLFAAWYPGRRLITDTVNTRFVTSE